MVGKNLFYIDEKSLRHKQSVETYLNSDWVRLQHKQSVEIHLNND